MMEYRDLEEAIQIHNAVPQGLSSAIFTNNLRKAEEFLSVNGSDCGIANVNIGTSVQKSAVLLVEKRRRAGGENPVQMPGKLTCVDRPTRSITPQICRWPRALNLVKRLKQIFIHLIPGELTQSPDSIFSPERHGQIPATQRGFAVIYSFFRQQISVF
jgi:hypothetical protein